MRHVALFFSVLLASCAAQKHASKWHPGIYVKLEDWQLQSAREMNDVYEELRSTPQLRGIKVTLLWGRYETRDATTGQSSFDFTQIEDILEKLSQLEDKHLIISFSWREFQGDAGAVELLPNDLRAGIPWSDDRTWAHQNYDFLWAYKRSRAPGSYAYNLKLWKPELLTRIDAFLSALGAQIDAHPNLTMVGTTESALGEPIISFGVDEGESAQYEGQKTILRQLKHHFPSSLIVPDLNYSREHVADVTSFLESESIGLGSSNSNLAQGLNITSAPPGVLTYYPQLSGKVTLAPEIQGDDYRNSNSDQAATPDYPSYEHLYLRVKNELKANYTVMQRNVPFWKGDASTHSMLEFVRTYPTITSDATGAGGLETTVPSSLH